MPWAYGYYYMHGKKRSDAVGLWTFTKVQMVLVKWGHHAKGATKKQVGGHT